MNHINTKENFCPSCVTIPLAMSGVGLTSMAGGFDNHKKKKKIILWIGIFTTIVSFIIGIYYICFKNCQECR